MSNQWLRLWHDMPTDPKWRTICRISGQRIGDVIAVYTFLLVSASQNSMQRGVTQCNAEDVSSLLNLEIEQAEAILNAMQGRVMQGNRLTGWESRQPKREDNSTSRVKAYREKRNVTQCNEVKRNVTLDKDTDKIREESKKEKNTKKENSEIEPEGFLQFWELFPTQRRGNREKAAAAYGQALKRSTPAEILLGLKSYVDSDEVKRGFAKGACAWLNDDRWAWDYKKPVIHGMESVKPKRENVGIV